MHHIVLVQLDDGSLRVATKETTTSIFKWSDDLGRLPLTKLFLEAHKSGPFRKVLFEVAKETLRVALTNGNVPHEVSLPYEEIKRMLPPLPDHSPTPETSVSFIIT